ncbi:aldehyde dehydrogenase family protein [Skermania sp. ID1734]|uniref:aldehyde dehydrogenase family protein n=1 Tax=Skermania sp. ID1734 TaxID=2597516 RepID=UPI00117F8342|nr:aldehyde dehydrogenase family protein [Skermania sp. ID1734]TSD95995.1 aldehyde dehydrogenase family protein [Skermania sp. ID1734]
MTSTPTADATIVVRNPANDSVVGSVADTSSAAVAEVIASLRAHQPHWESLGPTGRSKVLFALQDWILDNARQLADVVQSESGKVRAEAELEVTAWVDLISYWGRKAEKFLADEHPAPHSPLGRIKKLTTWYRPYSVVGVITPWNYPLAMGAMDIVPALMAGAAVLHKPSEVTPLSAVEIARGWAEVGAPPVFTVVTGGASAGAAVVEEVDFLQFTGSTPTGRIIARRRAETFKPYSLELGGKDPAIVLADADLDRAAHGIAWGALLNAGQTCVSIERVYVEAPVYDAFIAKLTEQVESLRVGRDDREFRYDVGALANQQQLEIVSRHVDEAVAAGARVLTGGKPTGIGTFFEPTVLVDVDHSMSCIREETFGPTIPVIEVADEDEAVLLANDSEYGLSASIWTGDRKRGHRVARRLDAGAVNINDSIANVFNFVLPMGGWKQSGIGSRWGGAAGIRKYCRQQALTEPAVLTIPREVYWFPYSKGKSGFAFTLVRGLGARGRRRLG